MEVEIPLWPSGKAGVKAERGERRIREEEETAEMKTWRREGWEKPSIVQRGQTEE